MARLYVDQNILDAVQPLRNLGHDVISAGDEGRRGMPDVWHSREALSDRRIIVALDTDFYYLHGLWATLVTLGIGSQLHAGILTALQGQQEFSVRNWIPAIHARLRDNEGLDGQINRWDAKRGTWHVPKLKPWSGMI